MSSRRIVQTFELWRQSGEPIVLATVYETLGSTYSKAGHRILIAANGDYQGLVSGGCLEGDLAERARRVVAERRAAAVRYDLRDEADDLWGLGIGCNGLIGVFLQPLFAAEGYEPFASIAGHMLAGHGAAIATVIEAGTDGPVPGATLVQAGGASRAWGIDAAAIDRFEIGCEAALRTGSASFRRDESGAGVLYAPLKRVPRLLLLGAGLDAIPVVNLAHEMGWIVTVADHRPAYTQRAGFERAHEVRMVEPRTLRETLDLDAFDAIVVMSHHLATDQAYLEQIVDSRSLYIGVLGPPARKRKLLDALGDRAGSLRTRLKGPVGLDIGADSPESIALSIVAELHATLAATMARQ
jgi:xanthine/CO dehydrogenase XdhC/CoxF family maturation factor